MLRRSSARSSDRIISCCVTPEGSVGFGTGDMEHPASTRRVRPTATWQACERGSIVRYPALYLEVYDRLLRSLNASRSNDHPERPAIPLYRVGLHDGAGLAPAPRSHRPRATLGRGSRGLRRALSRARPRPARARRLGSLAERRL